MTFNPLAQAIHCVIPFSHLLPDQLPGEHAGQGLPYIAGSVGALNLFKMHIFCQMLSSAKYSFTDPWMGGRLLFIRLELATLRTGIGNFLLKKLVALQNKFSCKQS